VVLIEPNLDVHGSLKKLSANLPYEIYADMNTYRGIADSSLDSIAMIHVLDHLLNCRHYQLGNRFNTLLAALHSDSQMGNETKLQ